MKVKNSTRKKRGKITKIFVVLWAFVFLIIGFEFFSKNEIRFVAKDYFLRFSSREIGSIENAKHLDIKKVSLEEFLCNNNVTVDESLLLVNGKYKINENYVPQVIYHEERDVEINRCAKDAFDELSKALFEKTGETLFISSAYRDYEKQQEIKEEEGKIAQNPGCSEHQTGLAIDVFVKNFAGKSFIKSQSGQFVNEKCGDYGFIIRYPVFGEGKTGISYEPWHLRYVGLPHSQIISNSKINFEEYIDFFELGDFYTYENYVITRQNTNNIFVPESYESAVVSEDNTGAIIITFKI